MTRNPSVAVVSKMKGPWTWGERLGIAPPPGSPRAKAPPQAPAETATERELERMRRAMRLLELELERERERRSVAEEKAKGREPTAEERIAERARAATARKLEREKREKVKRFSPIAELAESRMRKYLATIGDDYETSCNADASADGWVRIAWQGNVIDSLMWIGEALSAMPVEYWISFIIGFTVPEDRKVKTRLRRSDIEAAPYRRATYWRRASASHIASAQRRLEEICAAHEDMGAEPIDLALAIHWNPDNRQPNRYQEGMDHADALHGAAPKGKG